jgi:hypothetical protein
MPKTIIVVNRHAVNANRRLSEQGHTPDRFEPVISVRRGRNGKPVYPGNRVAIDGPGHVVYDPERPLPCGATVWIEMEETAG